LKFNEKYYKSTLFFTRRTRKKRFCQKLQKNLDIDLKIILLNYQNNVYVGR